MKKLITICGLLLFFGTMALAQGEYDEEIQKARRAHFEEALQLTSEESAKFWPLFDQYREEQKAIKDSYNANKRLELLSDEEVEAHILSTLEMEEKMLNLKKTYVKKMMAVMPVRKVALIQKTERQFKRALLEKVKERRQQRRNNRSKGDRN
ncbi:MAG: hypothetical protein AAFP19_08100 [Bacteroidota bacterium]